MVGAVHNVDYGHTELDTCPCGRGDLPFGMIRYVAWSPSTSVEQENDPCRAKVGRKVGNVVGGIVCFDLLRGKWCDFFFQIFLWENRSRIGLSDIP